MVTRKKATKKRAPAKRKSSNKQKSSKATPRISRADNLLLQNFVSLQQVIVDLSIKLNDLSSNMSQLLKLFEVSAEALVKNDFNVGGQSNKEIVDRLNILLEQNKLVARGISLMGERISSGERSPYDSQSFSPSQMNAAPVPFQRVSGNLNAPSWQSSVSNVPPMQNQSPPPAPLKQDVPLEVPGSEEEEKSE